MLMKPFYELLPFAYLSTGVLSLLYLEPKYAIVAALVLYFLGARIYNLRSNNRRTDPKRKRKQGILPSSLYSFLPFIYILSASMLYRFSPKDSTTIVAICLLSYGLYVLARRTSYRHHRAPISNF